MKNNIDRKPANFLEVYDNKIKPLLCEIDITLKTERFINVKKASQLLNLNDDEISSILHKKSEKINKQDFLTLMENGKSDVCLLYKRELECGSPSIYTCEQLAYIYNLEKNIVAKSFESAKIKVVTAFTMQIIFSKIQI